jgi:uncharacterized RDD family membrane protein YckC
MSHYGDASAPDFVTGDAVAVELRYAKLPSRSLAFSIDLALQVAALIVVTLLVGALSAVADDVLVYVAGFVATLAVIVGYPVVCETLTRGRTVGKLAVGLRVVRDDGGAIRLRHALVRGLLAVVEIYLFLAVSVISSLVSPTGKRVGDYLAGTVVVRERAPRAEPFTPWVHPNLQGWVTTLDLSRLQPATALSARRYLSRVADLTPQARMRLGNEVATEVATQISPAPPPGTPPDVYLSAVLAERARRAEAAAQPVSATRSHPAADGPPADSPVAQPPVAESPAADTPFSAPS